MYLARSATSDERLARGAAVVVGPTLGRFGAVLAGLLTGTLHMKV